MRSSVIAVSVIVTAACCSPTSFAADVRHPDVPEALRGTWAPSADLCSQQQKTFTLWEKRYADAQSACDVSWVEERAARPGTIYSAYMLCRRNAEPAGAATPTNLVLWIKEKGQASIGPALNALVVHDRCP